MKYEATLNERFPKAEFNSNLSRIETTKSSKSIHARRSEADKKEERTNFMLRNGLLNGLSTFRSTSNPDTSDFGVDASAGCRGDGGSAGTDDIAGGLVDKLWTGRWMYDTAATPLPTRRFRPRGCSTNSEIQSTRYGSRNAMMSRVSRTLHGSRLEAKCLDENVLYQIWPVTTHHRRSRITSASSANMTYHT